jgi:capsular exopolysaccharide synthesis family protein
VESDDALDLRQLIWVLYRGKWQVLLIALLAVVPAAVATYMAERLYRSSAMVQIDAEPVQVLPYKEIDLPNISPNYEMFMKSQEQILRGPTLVSRIAKRLQSGPDAEMLAPEVQRLGSALSIQRLENTQLFLLNYVAPQPEIAAKVANAFAEEYIKLHFESRQETRERARELLKRELESLEQRAQLSEKELVKYAQENSIPSDNATPNLIPQKLALIGNQLSEAEGEVFLAQAKVDSLRSASVDQFPEKLETPVIGELVGRLAQLEQQLVILRSSFGENWPSVVQKRSEIELIRKQLERERLASLAQAREQANLDYAAAENKRQKLAASMGEQQQLVHQMEKASIQYNIIRREVETNQKMYDGLLERLKQSSVTAGMEFGGFHVVEPALPSYVADSPKVVWNLTLAAVLGMGLGVCLVFARHYWDTTVSSVEEVEHLTVLPVLGVLPLVRSAGLGKGLLFGRRTKLLGRPEKSHETLAIHREASLSTAPQFVGNPAAEEGIRSVCASLLLSRSGRPPRVLMITSAIAGEGKTTLALELGRTFASTGARTLVVDCDLRRPMLHRLFDVSSADGLSMFLSGNNGSAPTVHATSMENLFVVAAGPATPNPPVLLGSEKMQSFLDQMTSAYQFVILDTPPVIPVVDARVLARFADGVALVVRAGYVPKALFRRVGSLLGDAGANVLGAILNGADQQRGADSSYYRYYRPDED